MSVVSASYSEGSIWSSLSTGSVVLMLNFLTRTFREDMVPSDEDGEKPAENPRKKAIKS